MGVFHIFSWNRYVGDADKVMRAPSHARPPALLRHPLTSRIMWPDSRSMIKPRQVRRDEPAFQRCHGRVTAGTLPHDPDKEFWYRLYYQALRTWTDTDGVRPQSRTHILWDCALAHDVWTRVLGDWGGSATDHSRDQVLAGLLAEHPTDHWSLLLADQCTESAAGGD